MDDTKTVKMERIDKKLISENPAMQKTEIIHENFMYKIPKPKPWWKKLIGK